MDIPISKSTKVLFAIFTILMCLSIWLSYDRHIARKDFSVIDGETGELLVTSNDAPWWNFLLK